MFKNLKPFFSFFLFSLFLFPSFFLFLPSSSSSPSSSSFLASDSRSYPSIDKWTSNERKKTLSDLNKENLDRWLWIVAFGLKELKVKSHTYHFDKIIPVLKEQIKIQKKHYIQNDFDFTQIKGEARKQLLQPYQKGTIKFVDDFLPVIKGKEIEYGNSFLESIRPLLLKMQVLDFSEIVFLSNDSLFYTYLEFKSVLNLKNLKNIKFGDKGGSEFDSSLKALALNAFEYYFIPNYAKTALEKNINAATSPWLHTLQETSDFNITHLTVDGKQIDVSSLVNSKVQEASDLSLDQIKILKTLKPLGLEKLKSQVQTWIDPYLISYKTNIQPTLKNFANTKIKKIKINNTLYQVDLLLKESNFKLTGAKLSQIAKTQLLALTKAKITVQTLENALLESYRLTIVDNLNALQDKNVFQVVINDKTYSLTELLKPVNKNKVVTLLFAPAKTELAVLAKNAITKTQLDTALATILEVREATTKKPEAKTPQVQKKSEQKKLIIGLSVTGGVLSLSSLGGFLYWFFKIKK